MRAPAAAERVYKNGASRVHREKSVDRISSGRNFSVSFSARTLYSLYMCEQAKAHMQQTRVIALRKAVLLLPSGSFSLEGV